jgi:ribosomal protein S18 acetylase RimI-like enzyme
MQTTPPAHGAGPDSAAAPVAFRPATEADIPALVDLVNSAYRGDSGRQGWTTESDLLSGQRTDVAVMAGTLAIPDTTVLLVERDGLLVACCELERNGDQAYFGMFAVRPSLQRAGLGKRVLCEAERTAAEQWGCRQMRMKVIPHRSELISWYERRGYHRTGETSPFPYGDERFGIPTRPDLEFEMLFKTLAPVAPSG